MIYNGEEKEGHMTPFFSFATLAYARVAQLHRKQGKKRKKETEKKIFKIQTTVRKANLLLDA